MKATQEAIFASLQRLNSIPDPVLKYTMFLEIMRMFIDIGLVGGRCMIQQNINSATEDLEDLQQGESNPADGRSLRQRDRSISIAKEKVVMLEQSLGMLVNNGAEYRKYFDDFLEWIRQGASSKIQAPPLSPVVPASVAQVSPVAQEMRPL